MGDEIGNGGKLQKEHFCHVKKIGGQHCHFVLLDPAISKDKDCWQEQKSTPCSGHTVTNALIKLQHDY